MSTKKYMNKIKVIKTEKDYEEALELMSVLIDASPEPTSDDGEKLSLLATLIEDYELKTFPESLPDPVDAILFRMDQSDLKPKDLIPFIGSKSKVSEVLSRKRPLTIAMMRSLQSGLGIPASVLLKEPEDNLDYANWDNKLVKEMTSRGYIPSSAMDEDKRGPLIKSFFTMLGTSQTNFVGMLRQSHYRSSPTTDKRALAAWSEYILKKASEIKPPKKYEDGTVNLDFMQTLAKLSVNVDGPILAKEHLLKYGIILIIEPHFPKTFLDGATLLINKDYPVIGLTLRLDRVDNFWFTLMHELAHISLHYNDDINLFFDEIEGVTITEVDEKENQADRLASEALVPKNKWQVSPAREIPSVMAAKSLAKELGIHIAIVAGKMRHEGGKYMYLNKIVNEEKVRHLFNS